MIMKLTFFREIWMQEICENPVFFTCIHKSAYPFSDFFKSHTRYELKMTVNIQVPGLYLTNFNFIIVIPVIENLPS